MLRMIGILTLLGAVGLSALASERRVIVISTQNPKLPANVGDVVRISEKVVAGGEITVKVEGVGKLINTNTTDKFKGGADGRFWVEAQAKEFEVLVLEEGKITITVAIDSKQKDTPVQTKVYTIPVRNPPFLAKPKDRNLIVVNDDKAPVKAKIWDIVRVSASRQSGPGETTVKIEGKAKLINTNTVSEIGERGPLVGAVLSEFEILVLAKGQITVTTTVFVERLNSTKSKTFTINVE